MRVGIIAALPGELKPLVERWTRTRNAGLGTVMWVRPGLGDNVIAVCSGMGADAVRRAFVAAEAAGPLDLVISLGWAGGLTQQKNISLAMSEIVDARTGERFALTEGKRKLRVVSSSRVADEIEKRRLRDAYGAVVVDMEAAAVARLAKMRGIPMCCFKAVSDEIDAKLPDINPFINSEGKLKLVGFLLYLAVRPVYWASMIRIGRRSAAAANELATFVERFLIDKDVDRVNRTGGLD